MCKQGNNSKDILVHLPMQDTKGDTHGSNMGIFLTWDEKGLCL